MRESDAFPIINPGAVRHSITIEQPPATSDAAGGRYGAWTTFATVRAKIDPTGGREVLAGAAFEAEAGYTVTIRYLSGLLTTMRVNFGGRLFQIANINDIQERHRWMILTCTEGVSHGV